MGDWGSYHRQTTRFLRESKQEFVNPSDITNAINRARREVAMRAMCVRRLTPISGSVSTCTVTAGGTGYSANPTVTISAPDFPSGQGSLANGSQATATAVVSAGSVVAVSVDYGGAGYFQPVVTITDATGKGATATATVSGINVITIGREQYPLSEIDVSMFPGVDSVYMVHGISIIYSNLRFSLRQYDFSTYQAKVRNYPLVYQYVPSFCSQTQQGADGIMFMYPLPSQTYQAEYDCFCLPQDLTAPNSQDVIPKPWDDVVPYFATSLVFQELQNLNYSKFYLDLYDKMLIRYSTAARWGRATSMYGRY
jgi:hypothetical protein